MISDLETNCKIFTFCANIFEKMMSFYPEWHWNLQNYLATNDQAADIHCRIHRSWNETSSRAKENCHHRWKRDILLRHAQIWYSIITITSFSYLKLSIIRHFRSLVGALVRYSALPFKSYGFEATYNKMLFLISILFR